MSLHPCVPALALFPMTGDVSGIGVRSAFIVAALPFVGSPIPTMVPWSPPILGPGWRRNSFRWRWRRSGRRRFNDDWLSGRRGSRLDVAGSGRHGCAGFSVTTARKTGEHEGKGECSSIS
jgi:hypothetical protein